MRTATKTGVKTSTKVGVALISVGAIAAALILVLPKTQPTPIKLQPIFSPTTTTPIPSSTFGNQTPSTTAPTKPDLSFSTSVSPAFANGKLTFSWGNTGNAPAKFMTGQLTYIIESLDINGKVLATSQAVAGNDGTGSMTYVAGSMGPATVAYVPPAGTVKVRITLDSNKLIAESNENNNVITFDAPLPDLSFSTSVSPAFANGKLTFSWGNTGNAPAKFMTGQLTYIIESLDINGKVLATSQAVAGNDGTGSMTYVAGSMGPATVAYVPPAGTVKVRITLDSNKLIAESNENNNVITFDAPLATSPALVPSSTPSSSPSYSPTSSGTSYVPSPTSSY